MIHLSEETLALARRLATAQGISVEDAIEQAVRHKARVTGVSVEAGRRRDLSVGAIAARKARIDRIAEEIAALPVFDPRSPSEIMDDLNAR